MAYDVTCRPTPLPVRAPIPPGWRLWSHGNEAQVFRSILGVERAPGMVLVERCCRARGECGHCRPTTVRGSRSQVPSR
ncbi:MAG TPA: hypothetical protein VEQ11_03575 [Chloroflexota bacterium]|nr:hypothetical protein [Chloroflexota bacterium]